MTRVSFLESGSLVKLHRMVKAWRSEVEPLGFIETERFAHHLSVHIRRSWGNDQRSNPHGWGLLA